MLGDRHQRHGRRASRSSSPISARSSPRCRTSCARRSGTCACWSRPRATAPAAPPPRSDELEREVLELDHLVDRLLASSRLEFATVERRVADVGALAVTAVETRRASRPSASTSIGDCQRRGRSDVRPARPRQPARERPRPTAAARSRCGSSAAATRSRSRSTTPGPACPRPIGPGCSRPSSVACARPAMARSSTRRRWARPRPRPGHPHRHRARRPRLARRSSRRRCPRRLQPGGQRASTVISLLSELAM